MSRAGRWGLVLVCATVSGVLLAPDPSYAAITASVLVSSGGLNVRSGPSMSSPAVRVLPAGAAVPVACQADGQSIAGLVRTTAAWDRLTDGTFVSDAYIVWSGARPPSCGAAGGPSVNVASRLNLRPNASTLLSPLGTVGPGQALTITCQLGGESVAGSSRTSAMWDWLASGALVSDSYVAWPAGRPALPWCYFGAGSPASPAAFIEWAAAMGRQLRPTYGVPVSVTVAQAILESGWGGSALSTDGNGFFGMKCFGTPGAGATGCRPYPTTECDASCHPTTASFRVYQTAAASFADHAHQLATLPRYRPAFAYAGDPDRFATEIHKAGYATSPTYAQSLIALMRQFDLYRYDALA